MSTDSSPQKKLKTEPMSSNSSAGPCILVTGGCGFIASHTLVCLLEAPENYRVFVVDNLANSSPVSLDRVAKITNLTEDARNERLVFHKVDIRDEDGMRNVFDSSPTFTACIHFAGLKVCFYTNLFEFDWQSNMF